MLAIVHACLAQAFFALTVSLALFTSAEWSRPSVEEPLDNNGKLSRLCAITTGLIYVQIVIGAVVRHTGDRVDAHLLFAALVALHVVFILLRVVRHHAHRPKLVGPAKFLGLLLLIQVLLGAGSFFGKFTPLLRLPMESLALLTATHVVAGALMLVTGLVLTLRSFRYSATPTPSIGEDVLTEQFSL